MFHVSLTLHGSFPDLQSAASAVAGLGMPPNLTASNVNISSSGAGLGMNLALGNVGLYNSGAHLSHQTAEGQSQLGNLPAAGSAGDSAAAASPPKAAPKPRAKKEEPLGEPLGKPDGGSTASTWTPPAPAPATSSDAAATPAAQTNANAGEAAPASVSAADVPTVDELRAVVQKAIAAGFRSEVSELLRSHGGDSISKLPEANRASFKTNVESLAKDAG